MSCIVEGRYCIFQHKSSREFLYFRLQNVQGCVESKWPAKFVMLEYFRLFRSTHKLLCYWRNGIPGRLRSCLMQFRRLLPMLFGHGDLKWCRRRDLHTRNFRPKRNGIATNRRLLKLAPCQGYAPRLDASKAFLLLLQQQGINCFNCWIQTVHRVL